MFAGWCGGGTAVAVACNLIFISSWVQVVLSCQKHVQHRLERPLMGLSPAEPLNPALGTKQPFLLRHKHCWAFGQSAGMNMCS